LATVAEISHVRNFFPDRIQAIDRHPLASLRICPVARKGSMGAEAFKEGDRVRVEGETITGTIVGRIGKKFHVAFKKGREVEYNFFYPRQMEIAPKEGQVNAP
jgi:hypothetical protein